MVSFEEDTFFILIKYTLPVVFMTHAFFVVPFEKILSTCVVNAQSNNMTYDRDFW